MRGESLPVSPEPWHLPVFFGNCGQETMAAERTAVDLAVLAHQEEATVANAIADIARQSLMADPELDVKVWLLANGCRDRTVERAEAAVRALDAGMAARFEVLDLAQPGKSRTVNAFFHRLSRPEAELLLLLDADCRLVRTDTLGRMVGALRTRPELHVFTGRPVKDIVHEAQPLGFVGRLIASGADQLSDFRKSIAGGLYCIRATTARRIHLPAGLPVEDGFVRAMMLTDFLTKPEHLERIDGDPEVFFVYESIRTVPALVRHQTRLIVGSAINSALYARIRRLTPTEAEAEAMLRDAAADDGWLARVLREDLPRAPFGYVPFHFLTKRMTRFGGEILRRPQKLLAFLGGIGLDVVAYALATLRLMRGRGAGHW